MANVCSSIQTVVWPHARPSIRHAGRKSAERKASERAEKGRVEGRHVPALPHMPITHTSAVGAARSARLGLRVTPEQEAILHGTPDVAHKSLTDFILESACQDAEQALLDQRLFMVSGRQFDALVEPLDRSAEDNAGLRDLFPKPAPCPSSLRPPEALGACHRIESFDCGKRPLNEWLVRYARWAQSTDRPTSSSLPQCGKPLKSDIAMTNEHETIRVFVGTDATQVVAHQVLAYSLRKHTQREVAVYPMRDLPLPTPRDPDNRSRTGFSC